MNMNIEQFSLYELEKCGKRAATLMNINVCKRNNTVYMGAASSCVIVATISLWNGVHKHMQCYCVLYCMRYSE